MKSGFFSSSYGLLLAGVLALTCASAAHAQRTAPKIQAADPNETSDGTMSRAAAMAMRGELRKNQADIALKAAANRAVDEERQGSTVAGTAPALAPPPVVVGGHNFLGLPGGPTNFESPADATGAVNTSRFVQLVNSRFGIYNRNTHALISTGRLNTLFGTAPGANVFDPQIIWDAQSNRFYYVGVSAFSATDNRLSFGFSRTANPATGGPADWCRYNAPFGTFVLSDTRLGDSQFFLIFGFNSFDSGGMFLGSDIGAISKPPLGTGCPAQNTFRSGFRFDIRNSVNQRIVNPVPSNQIDNNPTGFFVVRNGTLPSTRLWFINVTRNAMTGDPIFGNARGLTVPSYAIPPDALQPDFTQKLDTGDASPTQAVQAINPRRGAVRSFFTQHTTRHPTQNRSEVRWYEINPAPVNPVLLRSGRINVGNNIFYFNAAISPDRQRNGNTNRFGESFVINFNSSSSLLNPNIRAASSLDGAPLSGFTPIQNGVSGYRDFTCPGAGATCRWGDYAAAVPDPLVPTGSDRGAVWGTNQFGMANPPAGGANWRTRIFALRP